MILLFRALARLVTFVLLFTLAATGLAVAIFSLGGSGDLSIPGLANLVGLSDLEENTGRLLGVVEADGSIALRSGLAGLGAVAAGVLLLVGASTPARERLLVLDKNDEGTLAARRRALSQVAGALVEQTRGVTAADKVRLRPSRGERGGKLSIRAVHSASADPSQIKRDATASLDPLKAFELKTLVRPGLGGSGRRVQ